MTTLRCGPEELLATGVLGRAVGHHVPRVPSRPSTLRHETDGVKSSPGSVKPGAETASASQAGLSPPFEGEYAVGLSASKPGDSIGDLLIETWAGTFVEP